MVWNPPFMKWRSSGLGAWPDILPVLHELAASDEVDVSASELQAKTRLSSAALYAALICLETMRLIDSRWVDGGEGNPRRRVYRIGPARHEGIRSIAPGLTHPARYRSADSA